MALPRILLVVPLLAAGMYVPAAVTPAKPPAGTLGMVHQDFAVDHVTVNCGSTITMVNDSNWVHIIGPGNDGTLTAAPKGVPVINRELMETNAVFTTGAWNTPGTYHLTCSVHPTMNLTVVVTGCCCDHT